MYLRVPYGSRNKQRLFPQTALTSLSFMETYCVSYEVRTEFLYIKSPHSAHTMYLCVLYDSHNKQRLFPQTELIGWAL
jgi:hypothetical protein